MQALESVFGTMQHVTWSQECLRALIVFVYGLSLLRLSGRRTFGKWSALDIVVSIIVGSSLSRVLTANAPFGGTLAATTLLMFLHWILANAAARSRRVSNLVEGAPIELARNGHLESSAMQRESVSQPDLEKSLRVVGIEQVAQARRVVLEPSGRINVTKKG